MFWSQLWRKGIRKSRVKSRRSCSGPQPASLQMCLTTQTARGTKWKSNPCLLKTHCSPTAPLIPQTRRLSMFSSFSSHDFPPVKLPFSCPAVHPPFGRLFSFFFSSMGQGGRRPHSSEPHAPERHQQAASPTRSTTTVHGPPAPPPASQSFYNFYFLGTEKSGNNEFFVNFMGGGKKYTFLAV